MHIRRLTAEDLPALRKFWKEHWGDEFVVARGVIYRPEMLAGFIAVEADEWVGEVTYRLAGHECEIVSLDSLREGQGVGTRLIEAVVSEARQQHCTRVFLITTNDNLQALGFYQRRGFRLAALYPGALERSRQLKPSIPLVGLHAIPLRDELELELKW